MSSGTQYRDRRDRHRYRQERRFRSPRLLRSTPNYGCDGAAPRMIEIGFWTRNDSRRRAFYVARVLGSPQTPRHPHG